MLLAKVTVLANVPMVAMFLIGRIPKAGDIFTYKNLQFEVVDMDRGRVDKLLVIKRDEEE